MESPFFRSRWGYPHRRSRYDPNARETDVQRQPDASSFRVVNVPVRFVGSERSRSYSALKIQKVLRGFLVRKSVKKIMAMRREVDEIEKKLLEKEVVELILSNGKEKLKVNETLMNLLFNLDSVRGLDSGVRDCRKTVIKKVIGLQEKFDAIVTGEKVLDVANSATADGNDNSAETIALENIENDSADYVDSEQQRDEIMAGTNDNCDFAVNSLACEDSVESMLLSPHSNETEIQEVGATSEFPQSHSSNLLRIADMNSELKRSQIVESMTSRNTEIIGKTEGAMESERRSEFKSCEMSDDFVDGEMYAEHGVKCQGIGEAGEISDARTETNCMSFKDVESCDQIPSAGEGADDNEPKMEAASHPDSSANPENPGENGEENVPSRGKLQALIQSGNNEESGKNNKRNKELLKRMADENGRMVGLMMELFEKNETQTRLLISLTQRVEHLEKAIISEKLRKKKKRNAASTLDCSEKCRKMKKFGKKV